MDKSICNGPVIYFERVFWYFVGDWTHEPPDINHFQTREHCRIVLAIVELYSKPFEILQSLGDFVRLQCQSDSSGFSKTFGHFSRGFAVSRTRVMVKEKNNKKPDETRRLPQPASGLVDFSTGSRAGHAVRKTARRRFPRLY